MPRPSIYLGEKNESAIKAPYASINPLLTNTSWSRILSQNIQFSNKLEDLQCLNNAGNRRKQSSEYHPRVSAPTH
ncbi:uncharacterized protein METZ01_LOCUS101424 [marine metagenome]|uniref:Uncharacterized protein n=1 Tax=marine metagenome TaxID=408172 RepID=A0A381W7P4_9ZZZZ